MRTVSFVVALSISAHFAAAEDRLVGGPLSTSLVAWFTLALLWVGAGYFLVRMRKGGTAALVQ